MTIDTTVQDQKRRTLEALERRFALAEAELHTQEQKKKRTSELHLQQHTKKPSHVENERVFNNVYSPSASVTRASVTRSTNTSFKKGIVSFSGHATTRDVEANEPAYFQLSHSVNENLLPASVKIPERKGSMVDQVVQELLRNGDSAQKYMQGSKRLKIDNWLLLDNFVQSRSSAFGARRKVLQSQSKRSKSHMSMKKHKKCGSLNLPKELHNFDTFKPMHEMWNGYMKQLLKTVGKDQVAQFLLSADLHGAFILVAECKSAGLTGVSGIMIRETVETFGIITRDNKFQVVPKKLSVFIFQADIWKITLHGDKLTSRNVGS